MEDGKKSWKDRLSPSFLSLIIGLLCGVLSMTFDRLPGVFPALAVLLGMVGIANRERHPNETWWAVSGIVLGFVFTVVSMIRLAHQ